MSDTLEPIGLLAGWGRFPFAVAEALQRQGRPIVGLGIHDHCDPRLAEHCRNFGWIGLGSIGRAIRWFRRHGVTRAVMAGKVHKVTFYQPGWWLRHRPDWTGLRTYYRQFLSGSRDRKDDSLLLTLVEAFARGGIAMEPATDFAPELLVPPGTLAGRPLSGKQLRDIEFGWHMAKQLGGLDIGQTVCVKDQAVLALEAIEGTDACIRRAGDLCRQGEFTVVKVAKPQQDMRFDVPTVGAGTLESMAAAGARILAIEANRTILLDSPVFREAAERLRLSVVAIREPAAALQAA
ncbi:MAG TPA: UDP-2,3-diacylglucosamine diphosphatase LpxI [Lacipirellulaceae bacterium]|nr:UDP-2,3-diacylglucosamine diphosphatase LpxI [Lacipirellulaceae bacterium]HMP05739.1 UDP-2,3-diacylglucosamine diphosphatase LpxI [Lacipirellulaceae bacterium]